MARWRGTRLEGSPIKPNWKRWIAGIEAAASPAGRRRHGLCLVEGIRLVERALRAGATLRAAVGLRAFLEDARPRPAAVRQGLLEAACPLDEIPDEPFAKLTEGRELGGILALAELPASRSLADVLEPGPQPATLLVCVELHDPGNAGALVRTAHACGAKALLAVASTDLFHPKAIRTSMGSVFKLPVIEFPDLPTVSAALTVEGVRTLATVSRGGTPLPQWPRPDGAVAVVLGSEAFGLSDSDSALLDEKVTIPMAEGVDSFSINAAAAVMLYELGRSVPP